MKQGTADRIRQAGDITRVAFFAAGIIAAGALAWASRDNRIADHERRITILEESDQKQDAVLIDLREGMATLLERTKGLGN